MFRQRFPCRYNHVQAFAKLVITSENKLEVIISVAKSPVLKRASPFKQAFGGNRPFFARFSVISPVFCGFLNIERYMSIKVQDLLKINQT